MLKRRREGMGGEEYLIKLFFKFAYVEDNCFISYDLVSLSF